MESRRASTFSYNRNTSGLAVAYVSAILTHLSIHGTTHPMGAASVCPWSATDCLIRSAVDISHPRQQGNPRADSSVRAVLSVASLSMVLVQAQSGGVAILRWFLACLQSSFPVLLTLLLPLHRWAVVTTCPRKVKHHITAPLRVPRLVVVPPLAWTVSTRNLKPMFARMPPS